MPRLSAGKHGTAGFFDAPLHGEDNRVYVRRTTKRDCRGELLHSAHVGREDLNSVRLSAVSVVASLLFGLPSLLLLMTGSASTFDSVIGNLVANAARCGSREGQVVVEIKGFASPHHWVMSKQTEIRRGSGGRAQAPLRASNVVRPVPVGRQLWATAVRATAPLRRVLEV